MKKGVKLKLCNWSCLVICMLMLVSSVQMEACGGEMFLNISFDSYMLVHVLIGGIMTLLVLWHLFLHFGHGGWSGKVKKLKNKPTRWLVNIGFFVVLSGALSLFHNLVWEGHSTLGGIHGKIGFLFLLLAVMHLIRRFRYFCHGCGLRKQG